MRSEHLEMTLKNWGLLASLYVTQFIGTGFFMVALVAIFRQRGMALENLGWVYMFGLIAAVRFLWAPIIDVVRSKRWGHYRAWLIATQTLMVVSLLLIGSLDLSKNFTLILILFGVFSLSAATQDNATDGLACLLLSPKNRGVGNGVQAAGGLVGNLIGGGLVLMVYDGVGWQASMWVMAAATSVSLIQLVVFKEPPVCNRTIKRMHFGRIVGFWFEEKHWQWLAMLVIYPIGVALAFAIITPVLVDADWALTQIGTAINIVGSLAGIAAAIATGWLIRCVGRKQALISTAVAQMASVSLVIAIVSGYTASGFVYMAVAFVFGAYTAVVTVLSTLMMDKASPASPSTDFSVQFSMYLLIGVVASSSSTTLAAHLGYETMLWLAFLLSALAVLVSLGFSTAGKNQTSPSQVT